MPAVSQCLYELASLYRVTLTSHDVAVYWHSLQGYSLKQLGEAILRYVACPKQGRFFPKPADLLALLTKDLSTLAHNAWENVFDAIQSVGSYSNILFDDPFISLTIQELGGWVRLCQAHRDDWPRLAKQFVACYAARAKTPPPPLVPLRGLIGDLTHNPPVYRKTKPRVLPTTSTHQAEILSVQHQSSDEEGRQ